MSFKSDAEGKPKWNKNVMKTQMVDLLKSMVGGNSSSSDSSDSDTSEGKAPWKKHCANEEEKLFLMGAAANRDSDESSLESRDCKNLVKGFRRTQKSKKNKKSKKSRK